VLHRLHTYYGLILTSNSRQLSRWKKCRNSSPEQRRQIKILQAYRAILSVILLFLSSHLRVRLICGPTESVMCYVRINVTPYSNLHAAVLCSAASNSWQLTMWAWNARCQRTRISIHNPRGIFDLGSGSANLVLGNSGIGSRRGFYQDGSWDRQSCHFADVGNVVSRSRIEGVLTDMSVICRIICKIKHHEPRPEISSWTLDWITQQRGKSWLAKSKMLVTSWMI